MSLPLLELLPDLELDFDEDFEDGLEPRDDEWEGGVFAITLKHLNL